MNTNSWKDVIYDCEYEIPSNCHYYEMFKYIIM